MRIVSGWVRSTQFGQKVATLIGAQPHEIALAPNVSVALGEITSGLDVGDREEIVLGDLDFPTLAYQWLAKPETAVVFAEVRIG